MNLDPSNPQGAPNTYLIGTDFAAWAKLKVPDDCANLRRWHASVSARPSAKA